MTRPLRVLLYCAAPKADRGGVQAVVQGLAAHFGEAAVTAWPDGEEGAREWRLPLTVDRPEGRGGKALVARRAGADLFALMRRLAAFRPDVVNVHFPRGQTLYFLLLRRLFGFRLVISLHGSDLLMPTDAVKARLPGWLSRADAVTAVSAPLAEKVEAIAPGTEVTVIPNGIDIGFWAPPMDDAARSGLVAAGRLVTVKGFDILLRAFSRLPEDVTLTLCGEGEERAALEGLAKARGVAERVTFTGFLPPEEMRRRLSGALLFVLPSRSEGLPLGLLEAMACGTPAVATRVGGVPDVAEPPALTLCEPEDPGALAEAIRSALEGPPATHEARRAAREAALPYGAEKSAERYRDVYEEALSCSR